MSQPPASAVENISDATLRRIAGLASKLGFDGTVLLETYGAGRVEMLQDIAALGAELYLTTTIALETSGVGLPLPAVPRQRASDDSPSRLRGAWPE